VEEFGLNIELKHYMTLKGKDGTYAQRILIKPKQAAPIQISLYRNHYFIHENSPFTDTDFGTSIRKASSPKFGEPFPLTSTRLLQLLFDLGQMRRMWVSELPENIQAPEFQGLDYNPKYCIGKMEPKKPENVVQEAFYKFVNQSIAAVPAVSGVVKSFITKAAHGARLLCNSGRWNHGVSLPDFNSLYPFALSQLEIPTSAPTVWNDSMNLHSYRHYILDIDIISLKACPFYSYIKPGRRIADRFEIEDISRHCGDKYRITRGYVFCGPVVKVSQFIEELAAKKQSAVGDNETNTRRR
jgi:hypothetical protein